MMRTCRVLLLIGTIILPAIAFASVSNETLENLQPMGQVRISDGTNTQPMAVAQPKAAVAKAEQKPLTVAELGEKIYQSRCSACHAAGIAGAPKIGDTAAWKPRIAQGLDTLVKHAVSGYRAMPQKGTCMTCSNEDIHAAVEYMVASSK